jgi:superfamily II RNA helicase
MAGAKRRVSCRELFTKFNILPLANVNNMKFQTNYVIHSISTWQKHDLHMPHANLTTYQKHDHYARIKLFNTIPASIKSLNHDIYFN